MTDMLEFSSKLAKEIQNELGKNVIAPLESMRLLRIFRPLPHNPNERLFYEETCQFAAKAGIQGNGTH